MQSVNFRSTVRLLSGDKFLNNWKWAAQSKGPGRYFQAGRGLPSFIFIPVNFTRDGTH